LRVRHNPVPVVADNERFAAMSVTLRRLSAELGLKTCTAKTAGTDGIDVIEAMHAILRCRPLF
jgi:hypothetical protein